MIWQNWSRGHILLWFFAFLFGNFVVQALVFGQTEDMFLAVCAGGLLGVILPCWLLARSMRGTLAGEFMLGGIRLPVVAWSALAALGAYMPSAVLAEISARYHPLPDSWLELFIAEIPRTPTEIAVAVVAAVIVAPIAEELIFRGILYRLSRTIWGALPSALISAVAFALVHWEPWLFLGLVGLGLLYAFIFEATGSVTACVVAHAVHNGITMYLMIRDRDQEMVMEASQAVGMDYVLLGVSCIALAVACYRLSRVSEKY